MTRRRKDPFAGKENVRHFRLVQRPLGIVETPFDPSFDEMFEEYDPSGSRRFNNNDEDGEEVIEEEYEEEEQEQEEEEYDEKSYDFDNDDDGELVDIDAELDQFAEDFIDIESEDRVDRVKMDLPEGKVGEAAKYGILLDDRDYDYTKHLRLVGVTPGAVFIQAPGTKKSSESVKVKNQTRDFFTPVESAYDQEENAEYAEYKDTPIPEDDLKANHEAARQQFRSLLKQVGDDPMLREVIEALEDDRYVSGEFDDELVISLDNLHINEDEDEDDEFFDTNSDSDIEILDKDEKFPEFIPSEALKRQMEKIAAHEAQYEDEEFDQILNEYNDSPDDEDDDEADYRDKASSKVRSYKKNEFIVDIEGESDGQSQMGGAPTTAPLDEEAEAIYKYLKEHGRARGTTLYDKKRPDHLPPIHIAIAQYSELRRELAVNNEMIIQKYAQEDEEETRRQILESEKIISGMVKMIDDPLEMEKRINIETAKYLLKLSEGGGPVSSGPKKIIEASSSSSTKQAAPLPSPKDTESDSEAESEDEDEADVPKVNKGVARSVNESAGEKKARKAQIKAEKREKRVEKKNRK